MDDISKSVQRIRDKFKTELEDPNEVNLSFIDELNNLIKKIFNDDPTDIYTILSPEELEKWKRERFKRFIKKLFYNLDYRNILYFILLCTITLFLTSEAVSFYAGEGGAIGKTWFKAILTEVCFIFLSGYRAIGWVQTSIVVALRVAMFCLMVFVITSDITFKSVSFSSESSNIDSQVELLEKQIKDTQDTINFYKKKNWGSSVGRQEAEKRSLVEKLVKLKEEQSRGKNQDVAKTIEYKSYGSAAFRVMLMLISLLISRRIFKF